MGSKNIISIQRGMSSHWVGDGFPVNTMLSYNTMGASISPFLLLDYAGPANFEPSNYSGPQFPDNQLRGYPIKKGIENERKEAQAIQ